MNSLKKIKEKLGVSENTIKLTKRFKKEKEFTKIKDTMPQIPNYNFQADLLFLPAFNKFKYLLTVVDLGSDNVDFEAIRDKKPETVAKAFDKIFLREYLNMPYASIKTDQGGEFKGVAMDKFIDNDILVKKSQTARHKQTGSIESFNNTLSSVIMEYLADGNRNWVKILPELRIAINEFRNNRKKEKP